VGHGACGSERVSQDSAQRCAFSNLYSQAVNKTCDARCGRLVFMELFVLMQLRAACASLLFPEIAVAI
jgi:hypothetical protein